MNSDLYNFTGDLGSLSAEDMFKISQDLNTIEPSVGELAQAIPLIERLTFLDWVSAAFVMTIIIFAMMPQIKKLGTRFSKRSKA